MKHIELSQSKVAIVDDEDYVKLNTRNWYAKFTQSGKVTYAVCHKTVSAGKQKTIFMHRIIMNPKQGQFIDHINGDTLDNRKENLRICTTVENGRNRKKEIGTSSKYKGVSWDKNASKWKARIMFEKDRMYLGLFICEKEAALAYNEAAKRLFGEFAKLNEIELY